MRLRDQVRQEVGLPITVGVARTKFLAKVASAVAKPDGLLVVPPEEEIAFLHPLPVERLWGVGPVTAAKLHNAGVVSVGEVASLPAKWLVTLLGPAAGHHLHALAHNRDPRRVHVGRRRRSVGSQRAFGRTPKTAEDLEAILVGLVDRISRRLRAGDRVGRTVVLRLRFEDFSRGTRSQTLTMPTSNTETILRAARELLAEAMPVIEKRGITLLGVAIANLDDDEAVQLALPFDKHYRTELDLAIDELRSRFGNKAITRAVLLSSDESWEFPLLPDPGPTGP
jgi:DNA polymerase-4